MEINFQNYQELGIVTTLIITFHCSYNLSKKWPHHFDL